MSRISEIEQAGLVPYVVQLRYNGKKLHEIADILYKEKGFSTTVQKLSNVLIKVEKDAQKNKNTQIDKDSQENVEVAQQEPSAQDILYDNRVEVIKMYKEHYLYSAIAKAFNVKENDVIEFLSKRKKLNSDDYRQMAYMYSCGKSAQEIADYFGVNVRSIEDYLDKHGILTTSTQVISKLKENANNEEIDTAVTPRIVKDFVNFIHTIRVRYNNAIDDLQLQDNIRNNIYHELEMQEQDEAEQLDMLNRIKKVSLTRRELKDFIEIIQPLIDFLDDPRNKSVVENLGNISARIMNTLTKNENRVYFVKEE